MNRSATAIAAGLCALLLASGIALAQAPATRLSLPEAVGLALRASPTLRAKEAEYRSQAANEITAGLRPNPTGTFLAEQFGSSSGQAQYTISVGQTIELGGKRQRRLESARAATRVTGHELSDLRRQLVLQVQKSFTDALAARDTLALTEENMKALDEIERIQRVRADKGDISGLELLRIQVQRFAFERDAADARQALRAAKVALRAALGPERVAEEFEIVGDLEFREVPASGPELYRKALDNRPDLRAAEASRDKARADVNLAHANAWWDVTPQVEYQRIGPDNTVGFGVSLPLRIFDRNQGEIERTRAEVARVDAVRDALSVQVLSDIDTARSALAGARDKLLLLRDVYLPKARQVRETVEFAYRRGGASVLDFLDAQRTFRETSLEQVRALGDYWSAIYQLEAAVGGRLEK